MSTLSNLIFKNKAHKVSSPFGPRAVIKTSAGATSSFHNGVDYSTNGIKLSQYAIADGEIINCGVDVEYGNAKFVWVAYPALGVKMLHYHLDSIRVKKGQKVQKGTVIGTTGKTGMATGIHLHLGIKKLSGGDYFDAEKWSKEVLDGKKTETKTSAKISENYIVTTAVLNVREGAGTSFKAKTFKRFTADARSKIKKLYGREVNGYVKGLTFTITEKNGNWGKTPSGWVCLDFCKKV